MKMDETEFSIIIPVALYRDAEVLNSLNNVDYPKEKYEIVVEKGTNPSENRALGIKKAKFGTLIFLDDDACVEKDFLKNVNDFFSLYPDIDIVGGVQLTPHNDNRFAKISGIALSSYFGAYKMKNRYFGKKVNLDATEKDLTSAICVIKKHVFDKIGGFNPSYFPGEDPDLFIRAKKNNFKIASDPNIVIYHKRRPTFSSFVKQIYFYGRVRPKISKNFLTSVFIVPSLFLLYLIMLPLLLFFSWLCLLPLLAYTVLALIFSAYDSIKHNSIFAFILLPFLYFTMHISYGVGFFHGLLKKHN